MSYRNGDKSREHRLRKQRQRKRESVRKISGEAGVKTVPQKPGAEEKRA